VGIIELASKPVLLLLFVIEADVVDVEAASADTVAGVPDLRSIGFELIERALYLLFFLGFFFLIEADSSAAISPATEETVDDGAAGVEAEVDNEENCCRSTCSSVKTSETTFGC